MISTLSIPVQVQTSKQSDSAALDSLLPRDKTVKASVVSSQPSQSPDVSRVKLQLQNQLLEIRLPQQLQAGQQVTLNRQASGQILLTLLENSSKASAPQQPRPSPEANRAAQPAAVNTSADKQNSVQLKLPPAAREALNNAFRHTASGAVSAVVISSQAAKPKSASPVSPPQSHPSQRAPAGDQTASRSAPALAATATSIQGSAQSPTSGVNAQQASVNNGPGVQTPQPAAQDPAATITPLQMQATKQAARPTSQAATPNTPPATAGSTPSAPTPAAVGQPERAAPAVSGTSSSNSPQGNQGQTNPPASTGAQQAQTSHPKSRSTPVPPPSTAAPTADHPKATTASGSVAQDRGAIPVTTSSLTPSQTPGSNQSTSAQASQAPGQAQQTGTGSQTGTVPSTAASASANQASASSAPQTTATTAATAREAMPTTPPAREPAPPQTVAGTAVSRPSPESQSNSRGVLPQPGPSTPVGGKEGTPAATASTADSKSLPAAAPLTSAVSQPPPAVRNTIFQLQLALNNGSNIQLQSDKPLPQGSQLQFNLQPDGSVVSKVLQASSATTMSALDQLEIQSSLRQALPQQISLGNALTQLNHFATEPQNSPVSSVVRSMLQLFGFKPAQRSPSIIQQNIELGGHQTENQLAKTRQTNSQDMKSQLSVLQQLSKQLPEAEANRLDQLVQGIKARITGQQIQALQQRKEQPDGQFERVLQLDIPVHFQNKLENVELKISHEAQAHHGEELTPQWRVRLHFDLEEDGSVDAEIRLRENDQLSTQFWCNKQSTYLKLQQRLDEFNQRLLQQGYTEAELQCHHGSAPEKQAPVQKQLIDLRT